jgi:hypothetical protein
MPQGSLEKTSGTGSTIIESESGRSLLLRFPMRCDAISSSLMHSHICQNCHAYESTSKKIEWHHMKTEFLLLAQYEARAVIPLEVVCRDFFSHLTPLQLTRKATAGEIDLPIVRIETSQKAARGVHIQDLAAWIDARRAAAQKENDQLQGRR